MRKELNKIIDSRAWEITVITIIVINAITLGMETSRILMSSIGAVLVAVDNMILVFFVVEILLRLYGRGFSFFKDPWSIFDFTIVAIALVPSQGAFSVLRALRILRVLRLVSMVPSLKKVIGGLMAALPGMGSIILLMTLVFYVFSVMATKLYGHDFPEWFGSIGSSAYSLFQIMTLESWSMGIVRPVMEKYPFAWMFFVPFILSTAFTVLNLFIGIIVSAMQQEHDQLAQDDRDAIHTETEAVLNEVRALRQDFENFQDKLTK